MGEGFGLGDVRCQVQVPKNAQYFSKKDRKRFDGSLRSEVEQLYLTAIRPEQLIPPALM